MKSSHRLAASMLMVAFATNSVMAQDRTAELRQIYPYVPLTTADVQARVVRMAEDANAVRNIRTISQRNLLRKDATNQPWMGSYWPLIQGQIGNTYHDKNYVDFMDYFSWEKNVKEFKERRDNVLSRIYELSEEELARLAPSEKYDLLLGDTNFDLTNRTWQFVENYGAGKSYAFLTAIDIPEGFRLPDVKDRIESWEGICHGWALAATGAQRPEKTVTYNLPNGKKMPVFPSDVKALVSLMYANSEVQNEVLMEGWRCNDMKPQRDEYGRYVDTVPRQPNDPVMARCADVHPAVWFLSVVNITGVQGRAMVVELDANGKVNNHPFSGYEMRFFRPDTGITTRNLDRAIVPRARYRRDPFAAARNPQAVAIIGVEMKMKYTDWAWPSKSLTDSVSDDKLKNKTMWFDLELDAQNNVVGGQWRVTPKAEDYLELERQDQRREMTNQPDFFWLMPKNYMRHFQSDRALGDWDPRTQTLPPRAWSSAAKSGHNNMLFTTGDTCTVVNDTTGEWGQVSCDFRNNKPRPLNNLVNKLLELSRQ